MVDIKVFLEICERFWLRLPFPLLLWTPVSVDHVTSRCHGLSESLLTHTTVSLSIVLLSSHAVSINKQMHVFTSSSFENVSIFGLFLCSYSHIYILKRMNVQRFSRKWNFPAPAACLPVFVYWGCAAAAAVFPFCLLVSWNHCGRLLYCRKLALRLGANFISWHSVIFSEAVAALCGTVFCLRRFRYQSCRHRCSVTVNNYYYYYRYYYYWCINWGGAWCIVLPPRAGGLYGLSDSMVCLLQCHRHHVVKSTYYLSICLSVLGMLVFLISRPTVRPVYCKQVLCLFR